MSIAGIIFVFAAISKLVITAIRGWNSHLGELVANFPMYPILQSYNPTLYSTIPKSLVWWDGVYWFYGPFYHLLYFPLTLILPSFDVFMRSLMIIYIVILMLVLFYFVKNYGEQKKNTLFIIVFTLTFGIFATSDLLQQKNIELIEFVLLMSALLCLEKQKFYAAGSLLCMAAMSKFLPFIFFIYLFIKPEFKNGKHKAIISYIFTFVLIVIAAHFTLGWDTYKMFQSNVATAHGVPTLQSFLGEKAITEVSHVRGSLYTFILSFFVKIDMTSAVPVVSYANTNYLIPNLIYFIVCILVGLLSFLVIRKNKNDIFYDFAILTSLMLIVFPRCNPHYYIFILFGLYYISMVLLNSSRKLSYKKQHEFYLLGILLVFVYLMFGGLIPFSLYDRILSLDNKYYHYIAVYGIQGFAVFVLWSTLITLGYRKVIKTEKELVRP